MDTPHVTTLPSKRIAAKAFWEAWICFTFCSGRTRELSTTILRVSPSDNRSVRQDCSKSTTSAFYLHNILQTNLDSSAHSAKVFIAPCNHSPICKLCGKCSPGRLNLLDVSELFLHIITAVRSKWVCPRTLHFHPFELLQKHPQPLGYGELLWVALALPDYCHLSDHCPRSRHVRPRAQQQRRCHQTEFLWRFFNSCWTWLWVKALAPLRSH